MSVMIDKVTYDENEIIIDRNRIAINNSIEGRKTLQSNYSQEIVDEVLEVWGDKPTEKDFVLPDLPEQNPPIPTIEQRVADTEEILARMLYGG